MTHPPSEPPLLPGDNPQAYIPGDRRRALSRGEPMPDSSEGAAVFVDISGFTPLTEALARELGGRRGAEELTATLDRVFAALLERLHVWRGSVVYFSGDAVTAWIDGDDGLRATACALEMQQVMDRVGRLTTPGGTEVVLSVKVAVAVGRAHRFVVGDPSIQLIDVLAGRLMDCLADAEQQSAPGEVVLDAGALAALGDRVTLRALRAGEYGDVGVVASVATPPTGTAPEPPLPRLPLDVVRQWLLPPVWERIAAGRGEFLAELRPAVPFFVQFGGLDFDNDPGTPEVLDAFVTRCERVLDELGGYVLQLTVGDKGVYLYAVFGSPVAHEDDATRACEGALRLREAVADLPVTDVSIGVATGRVRSGTYGHHERRTFCCLGDPVNLAARLMAKAPAGEIWVHGDVAGATGDTFDWVALEPMTVKGKQLPVEVRSLQGRARRTHAGRTSSAHVGTMVGRDRETRVLRELWDLSASGSGQVVVVEAEAGVGKSRLVGELVDGLLAEGVAVAWSEATRVTTGSTYLAWRGIWSDLLSLDPEAATADDVVARVTDLDPRLAARAPLLGPVLGVTVPDTDLTASLEGEARKTSLEDLLAQLLAARARRSAVTIVLEDCHWLDGLSRELLGALSRVVRTSAVLLLLTSRPDGTALAGLPLGRGGHLSDLELGALDPVAAEELAVTRFQALSGGEVPSPTVVYTVVGRAEGNPFYLVQLVDYVVSHAGADGAAQQPDALDLPDSLHSLVLSRIDAQPEGPRRAVKVASVIGRTFASPLVANAYPDLGPPNGVHGDLVTMAATRLIDLEDPVERRFAFGHAVTRDVAYDSLPFGIRSLLHGRVAHALEAEPDGPVRHLDLLAFHFARSDDLPKRRHYLLAAARAARAAYANAAAVDYLEQVLPQVEPGELAAVLLDLSDAKELSGDWVGAEEAARQALQAALDTADTTGHARALVVQAELDRKQGRYVEAEELLRTAELEFGSVGDDDGRARVLHLRGTLASQQGDPTAARSAYEASLALRLRLHDDAGVAAMLTNLALVAEDEGDLDEAESVGWDALARRRALGDRRAISVSLMNMGMLAMARQELEVARERFAEAEQLAAEVGDPWLVAVGRHNLGNVTRDLGDLASTPGHLAHALNEYAEHEDLWSLAHVLEDVALWKLASDPGGDAEAVRLLAASARVRDDIGAPRFPSAEAQIEEALAPARARTSEGALEEAARQGHDGDLEGAVALARRMIGSIPV